MAVRFGFAAFFQALLAGFALPLFLMCLVALSTLFRSVGGVPDRAYAESTRENQKPPKIKAGTTITLAYLRRDANVVGGGMKLKSSQLQEFQK